MYKFLWNTNNIVFVLQFVFGGLIYGLTKNLLYASFVAFAVATILLLLTAPMTGRFLVIIAAALGAISLGCLATGSPIWSFFYAMSAVTVSLITAKRAKGKGAKESFTLLFTSTLPLGIGTVFGGAILLYQWQQRRSASVA
ncbi:MAG: hypothetical protein Q8P23_03815 [bacterium]|nr:hypothetical protein [bacterium]